MDKKTITSMIKKSLKMTVGDIKDEWKTPSLVMGVDEKGDTYIETRINSREEAIELRDKVKAALGDFTILQGYIGFDSINNRFWQHLTILDDITNKF